MNFIGVIWLYYNFQFFFPAIMSQDENPSEKKSQDKKSTEKKGTEGGSEDATLGNIITEGGRLVKMEVDYSTTCDEKIPEAQKMAKDGRVQEAVDSLMVLEKQTRTVSWKSSWLWSYNLLSFLCGRTCLVSLDGCNFIGTWSTGLPSIGLCFNIWAFYSYELIFISFHISFQLEF